MVAQGILEQRIFADSVLEVSWGQRRLRSWTTLTSFGLQAVVIGLLLIVPLLKTVGVPVGRALPTPVSLGTPPPPAPPAHHVTTVVQSNLADNVLITPPSIPQHVEVIEETVAPPQVRFNEFGVEGSTGQGGRDGGVLGALADPSARAVLPPPPPPAPTARPFRTSSMLQGSLIRSVQPIYPPLARTARIQGSVLMSAIIGKDGAVKDLRVLSGHPMLVTAAVNAVSQWRYRPYILNNEAIEVETQITVNFTLAGN